ncbi:nucleic acid-binding protein [Ramicandelaber brevisporus]|nr:nucleic acid-binding protein [Ramicandelaber brevisporus]
MADSTAGGSGGGGGGGGRKANSLRPVTIAQLNRIPAGHSESILLLDGSEVTQVSVVAVVRRIKKQGNILTYTIEDGTGTIEVREFMVEDPDDPADDEDDGSDAGGKAGCPIEKYGFFVGGLRSFNSKMNVNAMSVSQVTDPNQITFHYLAAIESSLYYQRKNGLIAGNGGSAAGGAGGGGDASGAAGEVDLSALSPVEKAVFMEVKKDQSEQGMHVDALTLLLANMATSDAVKLAVKKLSEDGMLYETVDNFHFKTT